MVIFAQLSDIEKTLSPKEMEKQVLQAFQGSDAWKKHQAQHKRTKLGDAKLFVPGEAVLGEQKDVLRERLGLQEIKEEAIPEEQPVLQKKERQVAYKTEKEATSETYKLATSSGAADTYQGAHDPNRPGYWATCNCGAEFHLEQDKKGNIGVKTYTAESALKTEGAYSAQSATTTYTSPSAEKNGYNSSNPAYA